MFRNAEKVTARACSSGTEIGRVLSVIRVDIDLALMIRIEHEHAEAVVFESESAIAGKNEANRLEQNDETDNGPTGNGSRTERDWSMSIQGTEKNDETRE